MKLQRLGIRFLSVLFPNWVARYAFHYITHPQKKFVRKEEAAFLNSAKQQAYPFKGKNVQTYTWEGKGPGVLCVHGWEGHSGNFKAIITALQQQGLRVHAFDAPAHGASSANTTNLFEISSLVAEMLLHFKTPYIISHSFGGVATCHALAQNPSIAIKKYLLFTVPDKFTERIDYVFELLGAKAKSKRILIDTIESTLNVSIEEMEVSRYVSKINVDKALILHDVSDRVIPIAQAERVVAQWPKAELEKISGTGHFKVLLNPEVIAKGIAFLGGEE